eukprot:UN03699
MFNEAANQKAWRYMDSAVDVEGIPTNMKLQLGPLYPEFAFAGESNAGKSTLLNKIAGKEAERVKLARSSQKAGP